MNEFAWSQWKKATRALASAGAILDMDPDSAASRAYYAAFHGVTAVLACRGLSFTKHTAVRAALHRDLIQAGIFVRPPTTAALLRHHGRVQPKQ